MKLQSGVILLIAGKFTNYQVAEDVFLFLVKSKAPVRIVQRRGC